MSVELIHALKQLEKEKGIDKEVLLEAIEAALISAYKKNFGSGQNVKVHIDRETGNVKVYSLKVVRSKVENPQTEISLEEAHKINSLLIEGDTAEIEVTPRTFGRIAAQTAKQVVVQRIREAERGIIYDEFVNKESDIVTGIVQRIERKNVIIDLGKAEAVLTPTEQVPGEVYNFGDRLKLYVLEVKKTSKGPQIMVSRTHPGLVKRLFELEVPEIHDGIVEIKSIAREAGSRTKIAVFSKDDNVDPVGACVGQKGTRVNAIVDELKGEKIDIIKWSINAEEYISSSLSPAKVIRVDLDEENKTAKVTVPDFQLSLAIGKVGQNARLAAKLTGWKIDIKNESELRATIEQQLLNFDHDYDPSKMDYYDEDDEYIEDDVNEEDYESDDAPDGADEEGDM
ncbi:MAG TPA: transcription termination/antitermination protein NusA [Clostridiaceae bacterium]|nr:transcription termination/antitermination protein NusA [Clostridiaceae bacterium]